MASTEAYCRAADRVIRLWSDLRRQAEAWSAGDAAPEIAGRNSDVAAFNRANAACALDKTRDVLVNAVAAILAEELGG